MEIKILSSILLLLVSLGCAELSNEYELGEIGRMIQYREYDEAKERIDHYLSLDVKSGNAWTLKGHIYLELEQDSIALLAYEKALGINPEIVEAVTGLGIIARKSNDLEKASEYYEKAIKLDPNYAQAYSSLILIKLKEQKFQEAVELGQVSFELDKTDPVIVANLAIAYHYNGDSLKRDQFYEIAREMGYPTRDLTKIFTGEFTILD